MLILFCKKYTFFSRLLCSLGKVRCRCYLQMVGTILWQCKTLIKNIIRNFFLLVSHVVKMLKNWRLRKLEFLFSTRKYVGTSLFTLGNCFWIKSRWKWQEQLCLLEMPSCDKPSYPTYQVPSSESGKMFPPIFFFSNTPPSINNTTESSRLQHLSLAVLSSWILMNILIFIIEFLFMIIY